MISNSLVRTLAHKLISFFRHFKRDPFAALRRLFGYFRKPLFLFQMGKVGSSTHKNTLQTLFHVYHLHTLNEFQEKYAGIHSRLVRWLGDDIDLITVTREPVGRKISVFFQNLVNTGYTFSFPTIEAARSASINDLLSRFYAWEYGIEEATEWYENHFKPATGVDIYDHPFDCDQGWDVIESNGWRILILRFLDINHNHVEALNKFLSMRYGSRKRVLGLQAVNVSSKKWYSDLMREFKDQVTFSRDEMKRAYASRYSRHFYSNQELQNFRNQWRLRD